MFFLLEIDKKESKNEYWLNLGRDEIKRSLHLEQGRKAKNVILFLGDGMSSDCYLSYKRDDY